MNSEADTFEAAAALTAAERPAYLDAACANQPEMRARIEALLRSHDATGFMEENAVAGDSSDLQTEWVRSQPEEAGQHIGHYKLLEQIGEGGFGVVWVAEQLEPVRRRVALKIIKPGMDSREIIGRFEQERQALAMMEHPNIAKVFDAGATDKGRPYFVMELVRGVKITDYCDRENLPTAKRLKLLITVCQAVQHAHQKGIIHRDLKPSNILVTPGDDGEPVPKVIDFGVAKAIQQQSLTDATVYTQFEQMIGTPAYMSPEQAGLGPMDIDTRSDVYSLGVLLYELLTGRPPFDPKELQRAGVDEMRRVIREVEPPKPSTRISSLTAEELSGTAAHRHIEPPKLVSAIRGDLDWIVMKALEKDRSRRYETANGLARDIQRFLSDEPVSAGPPAAGYRFRKFARRNKAALRVAAGIAALLIAATAISVWQAARLSIAEKSEKRLRTEAEKARDVEVGLRKEATRSATLARAAVTRLEIDRSQNFFAADNSGDALACLARLLRREPANLVVAERLLSALSQRNFCLPCAPPLSHDQPVALKSDHTTDVPWLAKNRDPIRHAEFDPDGKRIATAGADGTARIWDARSGAPLGAWLRHGEAVISVQFSPNGEQVVTASCDQTVRLWHAATGAEVQPPMKHDGMVLFAAFSPDGNRVVSCCIDSFLRTWDVKTHQEVLPPFRMPAAPFSVHYSSDGTKLLAGTVDGTAHLVDANLGTILQSWEHQCQYTVGSIPYPEFSPDGELVTTVSTFAGKVWSVAGKSKSAIGGHMEEMSMARFSPDGAAIATASHDYTARIWDSGRGMALSAPLKHEEWVNYVEFSPDAQCLVTGSSDRTARIWDVRTGKPLTEPLHHDNEVFASKFSPAGNRLLTVSKTTRGWLWDIDHEQAKGLLLPHRAPVRCAAFSPDGGRVATATTGGMLHIWDARTGAALCAPFANGGYFWRLIYSPNGQHLLSFTTKGTAQVWDAATGRPAAKPLVLGDRITEIAFSPDSQRAVTADQDGIVRVCDIHTSGVLFTLRHEDKVNDVSFSPDGKWLVTASRDHTARIWDAHTGTQLTGMKHPEGVRRANYNADGTKVLTAGYDRKARIWDAATGREIVPPMEHADELYEVRFSPDGLRVATASGSAVQIWDAQTGLTITPPVKHPARVNSLDFSRDGRRLLTSCYDGASRIFDVATGHILSEPLRHEGSVTYSQFSPDGDRIVTASADRTARIWDLPQVTAPVPRWLPELAEALAGQRLDEGDARSAVSVIELYEMRGRLSALPGDDYYSRWARWFTARGTGRTLSPTSVVTLAETVPALIEHRSLASVAAALRIAPDNVVALASLGELILQNVPEEDPRRLPEAVYLSRRAMAFAESGLRASLRQRNQQSEAKAADGSYERALDVKSQLANLLLLRAANDQGDSTKTIREANELVQSLAEEPAITSEKGLSWVDRFSRYGHWEQAAVLCRQVRKKDSQDPWCAFRLGPLLIETGDDAGFEALRRALVIQANSPLAAGIDPVHGVDIIAKTLCLEPLMGPEGELAVKVADRAIEAGRNEPGLRWCQFTRGLAAYRVGDYASAVTMVETVFPKMNPPGRAAAQAVLTMAYFRRGQFESAKASLTKGNALLDQNWVSKTRPIFNGEPHDWLIARILLREAKTLIDAGK